jgi:hypothetical protein
VITERKLSTRKDMLLDVEDFRAILVCVPLPGG